MESISSEKREVVLDILSQVKESIENLMSSSRCPAWAFTRLSNIGYPQYLRNVDEVICPRFFYCT